VFGRLRGRVEHCREHKRLGEVDVLHVYKDVRSNMNDSSDACTVPVAGDEDGAIHCESRPSDVRLCDVCRQCSARFGVANEALDGAWSRLMCRQCSNSYMPQNVRLPFPKFPVATSGTLSGCSRPPCSPVIRCFSFSLSFFLSLFLSPSHSHAHL